MRIGVIDIGYPQHSCLCACANERYTISAVRTVSRALGFALAVLALVVAVLPLVPLMPICLASGAPCHHCPAAPSRSQHPADHTCCMIGHNHAMAVQAVSLPNLLAECIRRSQVVTVTIQSSASIVPTLADTGPPTSANSPIRI